MQCHSVQLEKPCQLFVNLKMVRRLCSAREPQISLSKAVQSLWIEMGKRSPSTQNLRTFWPIILVNLLGILSGLFLSVIGWSMSQSLVEIIILNSLKEIWSCWLWLVSKILSKKVFQKQWIAANGQESLFEWLQETIPKQLQRSPRMLTSYPQISSLQKMDPQASLQWCRVKNSEKWWEVYKLKKMWIKMKSRIWKHSRKLSDNWEFWLGLLLKINIS